MNGSTDGPKVGRPYGKRSDVNYKGYTVLLRRESQRKALKILRDRGQDSPDFSVFVQDLLDAWLAKQAA